jgi:FkbM family methyltransferase
MKRGSSVHVAGYGQVATALESSREIETLFGEVEEYFECGLTVARGATVVDVGANIGAFAVAAARRCERDLRLFCFEPVPALFDALSRNLRDNEWLEGGAHRAYPVALSPPEAAGTSCPFYYFRRFPRDSTMDLCQKRREFEAFFAAQGARARRAVAWAGPLARAVECAVAALPKGKVGQWMSDRVTGMERLEVPLTPLSVALREHALPRIDVLKVDVEGVELGVLSGVDEATWAVVREVVVEADGSEERTRDLVSLVTAHGLALARVFYPPSTAGRGLPNVILHFRR